MDSLCICINLRRATNAVTSYYDEVLSEAGLSVNQYSLLSHINKIAPCSTSRLAEEVMLERTTLTRNVKLLLDEDYVADTAAKGTRRHSYVLTEKGREAIKKAQPLWEKAQDNIKKQLGDKQINTLMKQLENLRHL